MTTQPEYVLVPREPTKKMREWFLALPGTPWEHGLTGLHIGDFDRRYRVMLDAAPQVHAPAPDFAGNGCEQTRPSSPGAGAPREEINVVELLYSVRKQVHAHQKQLGEDWQDWADEIVGDLSSAIAALQQPSGWQPIETAPRDGTRILLCSQGGAVWMGHWVGVSGVHRINGWTRYNSVDIDWSPHYWMPLPNPPEVQP